MSGTVSFSDIRHEINGRLLLENITLSVGAGETLVLLGRSGSGKTTLLRMVNALVTPTSGTVEVQGRTTAAWDPVALRRRVGYVIQEVGLLPHLTVARNVGLVPRLERLPEWEVQGRVERLLGEVGLPSGEYAGRLPRQLSGGERQRVGLARALANEPPVLLLDEPFGALDPVTRLDMQRLFLRLRDRHGHASLFVTHDVQEALRLGTRIAVLAQGRLERVVTPAEFRAVRDGEAARFREALEEEPA